MEESQVTQTGIPKTIANIIINFAMKHAKLKKCKVPELGIPPQHIFDLALMVNLHIIDMTRASVIFDEMVVTHKSPTVIAYYLDLYLKEEDGDQIKEWVKEVMGNNPKVVSDIKSGKEKAYGFIIGQVMKLSKGKADAVDIKERIKKRIL